MLKCVVDFWVRLVGFWVRFVGLMAPLSVCGCGLLVWWAPRAGLTATLAPKP